MQNQLLSNLHWAIQPQSGCPPWGHLLRQSRSHQHSIRFPRNRRRLIPRLIRRVEHVTQDGAVVTVSRYLLSVTAAPPFTYQSTLFQA